MAVYSKNIIQRRKYIKRFRELIYSEVKGVLIGDTEATYGSGKTTILSSIFEELLVDGQGIIPIKVDLKKYSLLSGPGKVEDFNSLQALRKNYQAYKSLVIELSKKLYETLEDENFSAVDEKVKAFEVVLVEDDLRRIKDSLSLDSSTVSRIEEAVTNCIDSGNVTIGEYANIVGSCVQTGNVTLNIENQILDDYAKDLYLGFVQSIQVSIVEIYNNFVSKKGIRVVILADDFCWIIDQHIGKWFIDLINSLDSTTTVLFRTLTDDSLLKPLNIKSLNLQPFDALEVREYLSLNLRSNLFEISQFVNTFSDKIMEFSGGHPLIIELLVDIVNNSFDSSDHNIKNIISGLFSRDPNHASSSSQKLNVVLSVTDLDNRIMSLLDEFEQQDILWQDEVKLGLKILSTTRQLTHDTLINILKFKFEEEQQNLSTTEVRDYAVQVANRIKLALEKFAFISFRGTTSEYVIHDRVRLCLNRKFRKENSAEIDGLHYLFANYYGNMGLDSLDEHLEEVSSLESLSYKPLYRLENPSWQRNMEEWLFHLFHISNRPKARLLFTKVYMQAFDWYEYYLPFSFCSNLISLWKENQADEDFIKIISDFQSVYPKGFNKHGKVGAGQIPRKLRHLLEAINLGKSMSPDNMTSDERLVAGIINYYIGDGYRYSTPPNFLSADKKYKKAIELYEDEWYKSWAFSDLGRMYSEWGRYEDAINYAKISNEVVLRDGLNKEDHEVLSQNFLTLGDVSLYQDRLEEIQLYYGRALIHAFLFPFDNGIDVYSISWYNDIVAHVFEFGLAKLVEKHATNDIIDICQYFRSIWINTGRDIQVHCLNIDANVLEKDIKSGNFSQLHTFLLPQMPALYTTNEDLEYYMEAVEELREIAYF